MLMELAVHDSHFAKVKMLSELANRECVLRVSRFGKVLPAFKAITLNAESYPRKKEIVIEEKNEKNPQIKEIKKFFVNDKISLKFSCVIPIPSAEFSAFTIVKSIFSSFFIFSICFFNSFIPLVPTKSPTAKILIFST